MLMELTVIPLGRGKSIGGDVAKLIELIADSGLPYQVTAFGTLVEGDWDQVAGIAKKCYSAVRRQTDRVLILMRLDEYGDRKDHSCPYRREAG